MRGFLPRIILISGSLIITLLLIEGGLRVASWAILSHQYRQNTRNAMNEKVFRIHCLGESTTACLPGSPHSCWPKELERLLNEGDSPLRFAVINEGVAGTNFEAILSNLHERFEKSRPHMVIAMVGINDQDSPENSTDSWVSNVGWLHRFKIIKLFKLILKHLFETENTQTERLSEGKNSRRISNRFIESSLRLTALVGSPALAQGSSEFARPASYRFFAEGRRYQREWKLDEAIAAFEQAIELDPDKLDIYRELATVYLDKQLWRRAEEVFHQYLSRYPADCKGWDALGLFLQGLSTHLQESEATKQDIYQRAGTAFAKAHELCPADVRILLDWAYHTSKSNINEAITLLEQGLALDPEQIKRLLPPLIDYCIQAKRFDTASALLDRTKTSSTASYDIELQRAKLLAAQGNTQEAYRLFEKLSTQRKDNLNLYLKNSYEQLYEVVAQRRIPLVLMQYPMRDITELQAYLSDKPDVLYVSNRENFQKTLAASQYEELFTDRFAGDFGHCTLRGNILIAESVAQVVLKYMGVTSVEAIGDLTKNMSALPAR